MGQSLLATISQPSDFRSFDMPALVQLADELRFAIIEIVAKREGHLGASLGVVELTVALHYVFETPEVPLIWDVGHQAYGHKILTGRRKDFDRLRQWEGISGFPKREESPYDTFGTGHSSTSLSAILGMALAAQRLGDDRPHLAVIGDASIASGMAFEALNHLGTTQANVLIILNDNAMGIDPSVGALKSFFQKEKGDIAQFFAALNLAYEGPMDGHDLPLLLSTLANQKDKKGPRVIHIRTTKGKGFPWAEQNQVQAHAPGKFDPLTGKLNPATPDQQVKFQDVVGKTLQELFTQNNTLMAITPAMPTGSGLVNLMRAFPDRCLDVGIAEQHAVTLAAGIATAGFTPFCVIYATFLQRALDQVMHDVALQNLGVVFCIDRAGLVGHDGATHHGLYDLPFLRSLPNMTLLAPRNELQLRQQLYTLSQQPPAGPVAIRYPRGYGVLADWELPFEEVSLTQGTCLRAGKELAILSVGTLATPVAEACNALECHALAHYDLGCIKPLDANLLHQVFSAHKKILVVEENCLVGGAGSAVLEWANSHGYTQTITQLGIPDVYVGHGATQVIKQNMGLTTTALIDKIRTLLTP